MVKTNMKSMKRLYRYTIVALVALISVGCISDDADSRSTKGLGVAIWNETRSDLDYINAIFKDVVHLDYMLGIDNDDERNAYAEVYLPKLNTTDKVNRYLLTTTTLYNTRYTIIVDTEGQRLSDGGTWHISRDGHFELDIRPKSGSERKFIATFSELNILESQGDAQLELNYQTEMTDEGLNDVIVEYKGTMEMVDNEASTEKPLTLNTTISCITYQSLWGMVDGSLSIECVDELYNTKDTVRVDIGNNPRRVTIICYGEQHTIYE
jgi:hypothetical protein